MVGFVYIFGCMIGLKMINLLDQIVINDLNVGMYLFFVDVLGLYEVDGQIIVIVIDFGVDILFVVVDGIDYELICLLGVVFCGVVLSIFYCLYGRIVDGVSWYYDDVFWFGLFLMD